MAQTLADAVAHSVNRLNSLTPTYQECAAAAALLETLTALVRTDRMEVFDALRDTIGLIQFALSGLERLDPQWRRNIEDSDRYINAVLVAGGLFR